MEWVALSAGRCGSKCVEYSTIPITPMFRKNKIESYTYLYNPQMNILQFNQTQD